MNCRWNLWSNFKKIDFMAIGSSVPTPKAFARCKTTIVRASITRAASCCPYRLAVHPSALDGTSIMATTPTWLHMARVDLKAISGVDWRPDFLAPPRDCGTDMFGDHRPRRGTSETFLEKARGAFIRVEQSSGSQTTGQALLSIIMTRQRV